jgi:hypothetical protein
MMYPPLTPKGGHKLLLIILTLGMDGGATKLVDCVFKSPLGDLGADDEAKKKNRKC